MASAAPTGQHGRMTRPATIALALALSLLVAAAARADDARGDLGAAVRERLAPLREEHGLPALAGLVIREGRVAGVAAVGSRSAAGGATRQDWAGGRVLTHAGSNTMWFALVVIAPDARAAALVATNCGGAPAERACREAARALIELARAGG